MKERFWLFKRGATYYWQDSQTGEQRSLGTKDKKEAFRLIASHFGGTRLRQVDAESLPEHR